MRIFNDNIMDFEIIKKSISKPEIFKKSTDKFWDDEYISEQMLGFHLNPNVEAASKTKDTVELETKFIIELVDMSEGKSVLDLGCGPGLYVKEFAKTGAMVTGIDISDRSIAYANNNVKSKYKNTQFTKMNYLDLNFYESFDIVTLIFYDFCALNTNEQNTLLTKVNKALKSNGYFIFDIMTENTEAPITTNISVFEEGFWSPNPFIEIKNTYLYEDPKTQGIQYALIDEFGSTRIIRIYHRLFSLVEITEMLGRNGFIIEKIYSNLTGDTFNQDSKTYGIIARKA